MGQSKRLVTAIVKSIELVATNTYRIRLLSPYIAAHARAGQFVNVKIDQAKEILWRRPFSVHQVDKPGGTFDILFNAVGKGTQALSRVAQGQNLDIIGPLGNAFSLSDDVHEHIIVAGGLGIAPFLLFLQQAENLATNKTVFYGADTEKSLCCLDELEHYHADVHLATEDGSLGICGYVTDALANYLPTINPAHCRLYTCGPMPMLAQVQRLCVELGIEAEVSVETLMACGFGACMGCAIRLIGNSKYALACKDGPVFSLNEIFFND